MLLRDDGAFHREAKRPRGNYEQHNCRQGESGMFICPFSLSLSLQELVCSSGFLEGGRETKETYVCLLVKKGERKEDSTRRIARKMTSQLSRYSPLLSSLGGFCLSVVSYA